MTLDDEVRTHNVVLCFYADDFLDVEPKLEHVVTTSAVTLCALSSELDAFARMNARVLAISRDSLRHHAKLEELLQLRLPLLCDDDGDVGRRYGILPEHSAESLEHTYDVSIAVFIIDGHGIVRRRFTPDFVVSPGRALPPVVAEKFESGLRMWMGSPELLEVATLLDALKS